MIFLRSKSILCLCLAALSSACATPPGESPTSLNPALALVECSLRVFQNDIEIVPEASASLKRFRLKPLAFRIEVQPVSCNPTISLVTQHALTYITQTPQVFSPSGVFAAGSTKDADVLTQVSGSNPRTTLAEVIDMSTRETDWAKGQYDELCRALSYCPSPVLAYSSGWPFADPAARGSRGFAEFKRFDQFADSMARARGRELIAVVYTQSKMLRKGYSSFYLLKPNAIALDFR